jgi:glycosyltransferase involved in cell wall biosynthesis
MKLAFLTSDNRNEWKTYEAPAPVFGPAPEALLQGFALVPEVEVHVIACTREPLQAPAKVAPNIFFHCLLVPKIGWMRTLFQGCVRAVRKKLRDIQPVMVHGQGTESYYALAAVLSGLPNVVTIHGNMRRIAMMDKQKPFSYLWLVARLEQFALPRTQGVVCLSQHTRRQVADIARRTWVVPNAVEASFFEVKAHPLPGAPPRILCVARVCALKNQNALIRALDPVAAQRKFELSFCGPVSESEAYGREFLSLVQARPWCVHHGLTQREELQGLLRQSSLLVLPTLEDNCPMVVLEAMAAGVPVVAARVGGVPDLIEEGRTGFLCDPLNAASMAGAVEKVLANPAAAAEVARQAQQRARERFHPQAIARRHLEIYREVLRVDRRPSAP